MKPSEIIAADTQRLGLNPEEVLSSVQDAVKNKGAVLVRKNNSVLLLIPIQENVAEWAVFTQDDDATLEASVGFFINETMKTDAYTIYGDAVNDRVLRAMDANGIQIYQSDRPDYDWMAMLGG
jgi:hypothetical protein